MMPLVTHFAEAETRNYSTHNVVQPMNFLPLQVTESGK